MNKKQYVAPLVKEILNDAPHQNFYAVMEFRTEQELSLSYDSTSLLCTNIHYFRNGVKAMGEYLYNPNPNIKMATGDTAQELKKDILRKIRQINNN